MTDLSVRVCAALLREGLGAAAARLGARLLSVSRRHCDVAPPRQLARPAPARAGDATTNSHKGARCPRQGRAAVWRCWSKVRRIGLARRAPQAAMTAPQKSEKGQRASLRAFPGRAPRLGDARAFRQLPLAPPRALGSAAPARAAARRRQARPRLPPRRAPRKAARISGQTHAQSPNFAPLDYRTRCPGARYARACRHAPSSCPLSVTLIIPRNPL